MRVIESYDLIFDDVYVFNENFVELKCELRFNGWFFYILSCYLGIV